MSKRTVTIIIEVIEREKPHKLIEFFFEGLEEILDEGRLVFFRDATIISIKDEPEPFILDTPADLKSDTHEYRRDK